MLAKSKTPHVFFQITKFARSEENMIRAYRVLIERVPLLKDLSEQGDAESLNLLYKNVRPSFCHCSLLFNTMFGSYAKVLIWPGEMTPAISRPLL